MKKIIYVFILFIGIIQIAFSQTGKQMLRMSQLSSVVVPISEIQIGSWDLTMCPNNPEFEQDYDGVFGDKDVNKLRTIPYSPSSNEWDNSFINNHKFWFSFGCCGENTMSNPNPFCADDNVISNVYTDAFYDVGSLYMPDVEVGYETSVWVNFMTQCEDCVNGGAESGEGAWFKWEGWYEEWELASYNSYPGSAFITSELVFQQSAPCDPFSVYGCEGGELD